VDSGIFTGKSMREFTLLSALFCTAVGFCSKSAAKALQQREEESQQARCHALRRFEKDPSPPLDPLVQRITTIDTRKRTPTPVQPNNPIADAVS
jgi:hypothetical protein